MPEGEFIGVVLGVLVVVVVVRTLTGAVLLRAAVALHNAAVALNNKLACEASSAHSVPEPAYRKAMRYIFDTTLAQMVAGYVIGAVAGPRGQYVHVDMVTLLIAVPVNLLIMAGILSERLPTTFGRAFLVTLWYTLLEILLVGAVAGIVVLVFRGGLR